KCKDSHQRAKIRGGALRLLFLLGFPLFFTLFGKTALCSFILPLTVEHIAADEPYTEYRQAEPHGKLDDSEREGIIHDAEHAVPHVFYAQTSEEYRDDQNYQSYHFFH